MPSFFNVNVNKKDNNKKNEGNKKEIISYRPLTDINIMKININRCQSMIILINIGGALGQVSISWILFVP